MDNSTISLLIKARRCADVRDWEQSLRCYDEASLRFHKKVIPLEISNSRAAVLVKLRRLAEASMQARQMVRDHPGHPESYLRLAQIQRYQARQSHDDKYLEEALKTLDLGIKRFDKSNRGYISKVRAMRRTFMEIQTELKLKVLPDPAVVLPKEIFEIILRFCSLRDLLCWRRVSRLWYGIIQDVPSWRHLEIDDNFRPSAQQLRVLLKLATTVNGVCNIQCFRIFRHLRGRNSKISEEDAAIMVLQKSGRIREITLDILPVATFNRTLRSIRGQNLVTLEILPSHLTSWELYTYPEWVIPSKMTLYTHKDVLKLVEDLKSLERLYAAGFEVTSADTWSWPLSRRPLRSLRLRPASSAVGTAYLLDFSVLNVSTLAKCVTELSDFEFSNCPFRSPALKETDWALFPNLTSLRLSALRIRGTSFGAVSVPQKLPDTLRSLYVEAWGALPYNIEACDPDLSADNLVHLYLSWHLATWVQSLLEHSTCLLESITFAGGSHGMDDTQYPLGILRYLAAEGRLGSLRSFSLASSDIGSATDQLALYLAEHCPRLESCTIAGECGFSGIGIGALCNKGASPLRHLSLGRCPKIGVDTIRYLGSVGIDYRVQVAKGLV